MAERKYQDVEKLLEQNPGMTIPEAGRQLGYERELQNKGQGRIGLRNRQVDQARVKAEAIQRGEAPRYKPPKVPGFQLHHKRMVMLYRPLFEGLSDADALELSKYAAAQGLDLGDVESNFELLSIDHHNKIHRYMEQQGMRPSYMPDFSKADLANRKKAFDVLYKDFIQADIDKTTSLLIEKATRKTELPKLFAKSGSIHFNPQPDIEQFMASGAAALAQEEVNKGLSKMGLPPLKGTQMYALDPLSAAVIGGVQAVKDTAETVRKNVPRAFAGAVGAATAIEPEAVKSALEGDYREAATQTVVGGGIGALVEFGIKKATPIVSQAAAKVLPKAALSIVGGAAKFVPVLAGGYAGYEMVNAIVEGATGKNLQETGIAAEETKQKLRKEGYSEYDLRRRARTGYKRR